MRPLAYVATHFAYGACAKKNDNQAGIGNWNGMPRWSRDARRARSGIAPRGLQRVAPLAA